MSDKSDRNLTVDVRLITGHTGKGLIVLLHGAPGVGKTSTAGESSKEVWLKSL